MALESPRGSLLTIPGAVLPAGTSVLWGRIWVGESDIRAALGPQLGSCCPAIFIFSYFILFFLFFGGKSRETQTGYSELICVIRLKKKADTGYGQGFYQQGIYFFFCIGA